MRKSGHLRMAIRVVPQRSEPLSLIGVSRRGRVQAFFSLIL
ncbi:hypothetical protein HMPREF1986_02198 [Oribacterium sp. oral taxon 078 str. F0263]|nr:hypothetical protein GCWU000341_02224 [Oribacterium sp. oral taxon 078 str. F0262]ERL19742.1 hypothetical protein HMPREF1986_02198 [Oribacterium sp. oral taxon 078 str. F0263]